MSSVNAGCSCPGSSRGGSSKVVYREKQSRRPWSPAEEAFLIQALHELVAISWKTDNSFKMGYQQRLEEMIAREFPGTNIRMNLHINSNLQTWKKQHQSLNAMLARSGVGFNSNGKHMIECEDEQLEQIVKVDGNARSMRYKSWPFLEDWNAIFGKDRATGEHAEHIADTAKDINNEAFHAHEKDDGKQTHTPHDVTADDEGENNACHNCSWKEAVNKPSGKGKKRKQTDNISVVASTMSEISRCTSLRLEEIANRIGHEVDIDAMREAVFNSLKTVPGLSLKQMFDVAEIFVDKTERFLLFKGLPPGIKGPYVQRLLKKSKPSFNP